MYIYIYITNPASHSRCIGVFLYIYIYIHTYAHTCLLFTYIYTYTHAILPRFLGPGNIRSPLRICIYIYILHFILIIISGSTYDARYWSPSWLASPRPPCRQEHPRPPPEAQLCQPRIQDPASCTWTPTVCRRIPPKSVLKSRVTRHLVTYFWGRPGASCLWGLRSLAASGQV